MVLLVEAIPAQTYLTFPLTRRLILDTLDGLGVPLPCLPKFPSPLPAASLQARKAQRLLHIHPAYVTCRVLETSALKLAADGAAEQLKQESSACWRGGITYDDARARLITKFQVRRQAVVCSSAPLTN